MKTGESRPEFSDPMSGLVVGKGDETEENGLFVLVPKSVGVGDLGELCGEGSGGIWIFSFDPNKRGFDSLGSDVSSSKASTIPLVFSLSLVSGSGDLEGWAFASDQKGFLRTEKGLLTSRMEVGLITGASGSEKPFKVVKPVNNLGKEVAFLYFSDVGDGREPFSAIKALLPLQRNYLLLP